MCRLYEHCAFDFPFFSHAACLEHFATVLGSALWSISTFQVLSFWRTLALGLAALF